MKKLFVILTFLLMGCFVAFSQKNTPIVDSKGHILRGTTQIGSLTEAGGYDKSEILVSRINSNGQTVDLNGKVIGRLAKGKSFVYYFEDKPENFTIGKPSHTGMCEVKNSKGQTVMLLHKNYKREAACAVHCLYENQCMPEKKMK